MKVGMYSDAALLWLVDTMPLSAIYHRHTMISLPDSAEGTCQEVRPSVPQIHALRVQAVLCPNTRCEVSHTQHYATTTPQNKEKGGARTEGRDRLHDVTMNFVTSASCFTSPRAGSPSEARARASK